MKGIGIVLRCIVTIYQNILKVVSFRNIPGNMINGDFNFMTFQKLSFMVIHGRCTLAKYLGEDHKYY